MPALTYKVVSATYQGKTYADSVLQIDDSSMEVELKSWTGRRKKVQTTVVSLRLEPTVGVLVDGAALRVLDLTVTLESPERAGEVAEVLRRPGKKLEAVRRLSEVEALVREFLDSRDEALTFLSKMKTDPRATLLESKSMWTSDVGKEPLEEIRSKYSERVSESLGKMMSSLSAAEVKLGPKLVERIYALSYTIGAVQDALFEGKPSLEEELVALQEVGVAATAEDLRLENPTKTLLERAHPVLVSIATAAA
jgi:hypothetical protein